MKINSKKDNSLKWWMFLYPIFLILLWVILEIKH